MALLPTKTYSKRNHDLSTLNVEREKENVDPFDELFSSPLKQDVQFKPLSFFGKSGRDTEPKKKSKTIGLYETSDSDENSSPVRRKQKPKSRSLVSKRTLKSKISKLSARGINKSTAYSFIRRTKPKLVETSNFKHEINNNSLTNKTLYLNDKMEETLKDCKNDLDTSQPNDKKVMTVNSTLRFSESVEETLKPLVEDHINSKFISVRRPFNYPNFYNLPDTNLNCSLNSSWNVSRSSCKSHEDVCMNVDCVNDEINSTNDDSECFINSTLVQTSLDCTFNSLNSTSLINDESETISIQDCQRDNAFSDSFDYISFESTKLKDLIVELLEQQNANILNTVTADLSSTSDDTFSESNNEDTKISLESEKSPVSNQGFEEETIHSTSASRVSELASKISNLTLSNAIDDELSEFKTGDPNHADKEDLFWIDLRNVTTKRRGFLSNRYDEVVPCSDNTRSSTDPRMSVTAKKMSESVLEESVFNQTLVLKPGKKWLRSLSVLKQLQNRSMSENILESTRITGRKYESFVQDMMEMQNAFSRISNITCTGVSEQNSFFGHQTVLSNQNESDVSEFFSFNDSISAESAADKTVLEKVLLNRTVKVIQPEEGSSAFRNALGLESSHVTIQEESSCLSARDFILIQCGQEDILPFEEYFNERTLLNCKKIGEGVYGEVFMCSDTVIKIIPIEGSDKVNGGPQKTFEEIISEVVIASKLSNLRNGEQNQTDGFSEMKRCWCVKGKYPKHLLHLWNEYDQLGSGSENDSPVMFKDDQLYIILELANGGKDLESFVFNSAAQSLSVFIQAAFSLAVAEKAFEFEHRDLHWGNVLISETKDKFMTVVLDGTKHKIPTKGCKVCIIDFTLSRMNHEGCCIFNDLSADPELFISEGDYQFEIYRMMLREVKNDWSLFRPRNNIFWLHYTLDKMLKMVRYKNKKTKTHAKHLKELKSLEEEVLEHNDTTEFVLSDCVSSAANKL